MYYMRLSVHNDESNVTVGSEIILKLTPFFWTCIAFRSFFCMREEECFAGLEMTREESLKATILNPKLI